VLCRARHLKCKARHLKCKAASRVRALLRKVVTARDNMQVGAMKMDDGQMEFNRSINTGAKPTYKQLHLYDFMISDGTVLRAE